MRKLVEDKLNVLVAPNSMKGSMKALEFAEIIEKAFLDFNPEKFNIIKIPIADGGDGTLEVLIQALGLKIRSTKVADPLGRSVDSWFAVGNEIAAIEMAEASGMKLLKNNELNPMLTSSFGTGQLIREAINYGSKNILLGIGGSATVDGGMGLLQALGVRFYDRFGNVLNGNGRNMIRIDKIDTSGLIKMQGIKMHIITDVENQLLGENGAARMFGPQKGADNQMIEHLESGLENFAKTLIQSNGFDTTVLKGGGAAGGVAIGLVALCNAEMLNGADYIFELLKINEKIDWATHIITGEGKLDRQSFYNKAPLHLALKSKEKNRPAYAIVGVNDCGPQDVFCKVFQLTNENISVHEAIKNARELIYKNAAALAQFIMETSPTQTYSGDEPDS
jgi:glycerate kinase